MDIFEKDKKILSNQTNIVRKQNSTSLHLPETSQQQSKNIEWQKNYTEDEQHKKKSKSKSIHYKRIGSQKKIVAYKKQITQNDWFESQSDWKVNQEGISKRFKKENKENDGKIKRIGAIKRIEPVIYDAKNDSQKQDKIIEQKPFQNNDKMNQKNDEQLSDKVVVISDHFGGERSQINDEIKEEQVPFIRKDQSIFDKMKKDPPLEVIEIGKHEKIENNEKKQDFFIQNNEESFQTPDSSFYENKSFSVHYLLHLPQISELLNKKTSNENSLDDSKEEQEKISKISQDQSIKAKTLPEKHPSFYTIGLEQEKEEKFLKSKKEIDLSKKKFFEERKSDQIRPLSKTLKKKNISEFRKKDFPDNLSQSMVQQIPKGIEKGQSMHSNPTKTEKQIGKKVDYKNFKKHKKLENASVHSCITEARKEINFLK